MRYPCMKHAKDKRGKKGKGRDRRRQVENAPPTPARTYQMHCSHVVNTRFTHKDSHVISVGGNDCSVFQWRHQYARAIDKDELVGMNLKLGADVERGELVRLSEAVLEADRARRGRKQNIDNDADPFNDTADAGTGETLADKAAQKRALRARGVVSASADGLTTGACAVDAVSVSDEGALTSRSSVISSVAGASIPPPRAAAAAKSRTESRCRALYDYAAGDDDELSFKAGDEIIITTKRPSGEDEDEEWWKGVIDGRTGIFPSNYVEMS